MKKKTMWIFIVCYLAYTAIYVARVNLSMASPELQSLQMMDKAQIGLLGSMFSVVYAFGRMINGYIGDKQPPWIMISVGLFFAGVSNISIGFFPPFLGIMLLWGVNAFSQSMLWSSVLKIVSNIYDEQTAKKKTSYIVTSVAMGNILGIILNTVIIKSFGVNYAFIIPGGLTLVFCGLIILVTRKIECDVNVKKEHKPMLQLFREKEMRVVIGPAMLHGVMKDNISVWMALFFADTYGIELEQIAGFVLFIPLVGFLGRMIYPACYKLCGEDEHKVSVMGFMVCILSAIPICFRVHEIIAVVCLSLIYTAVSVINTSMLSIFPMHYIKSGNVASVSGIMDFATYLGAGIGSMVYGFVIKNTGIYAPMYISWAVISLASIFILMPLIKKRKK